MKVIVVGAGIIGAAVADALATRGADVAVFDMRSPGRGASQASAGMLAPYTEAHGDARLFALGARSLTLFDSFVSGLRAATGRTIEYQRSGTLEVAFDAARAEELATSHRELVRRGIAAHLVDAVALGDVEPAVDARAFGGLLIEPHGFVGVDAVVAALMHRARFSGATLESPVEAVGVEERGDTVTVRLGTRQVTADMVVIAAGCWSGRVRVKHLPALPMRPVRGQLLHLAWTAPPAPRRIVWGPRCYVVTWSDGTVLVGATAEDAGFDESTTAAGIRDLTAAVCDLLPGSASARLMGARVGLRPMLPDGLPAIGPLTHAPRIVMATGHYRNGVLLAPLTAELVARYVLDGVRDEALEALSPERFLR